MATIQVEDTTRDDLKKFCTRYKITQGEFVKLALVYFRKSGINPAEPPESVKEELSKIEKRISQLIAFQRTFEKENMLPLVEALLKTESKINQHFAGIPDGMKTTLEAINTLYKQTRQLEQTTVSGLQKGFYESREATEKTIKPLSQKLDIVIEHGASEGGMNSSIKKHYEKQKK